MKSILFGVITCMTLFIVRANAQNANTSSVKDSIHIFYDQLFEELEANFLYRDEVDWPQIKSYIKGEALNEETFEASLNFSSTLFDTIRGDHLLLFSEKYSYGSTLKKQLSQEQFSRSLLELYSKEHAFHIKLLEGDYGYVFIPGMLLLHETQEQLDSVSQKIYDAVVDLDTRHPIKGWIIDLRLNIGGNSNVMLTGLYHLLGNGTNNLSLDANKHLKMRAGMVDGAYYQNHEIINRVDIRETPKADIPVALITGLMTASAGEFVVLGFKGRKNSVVIGEETYALTTSNDLFPLPFNTKAAITISYGTDRTGVFTKSIHPDIRVSKGDNFEDLSKDENIIEAIKFIDGINRK